VDFARVYVTDANGDAFYATAELPTPGFKSIGISSIGRGRPLDTMYRMPPPPGQIVRHFSGRIYIASGNILYFTDALRYEAVTPARSILMFPNEITLLEPAADGLYIGHGDSVDFLAGTDPFKMQRRLALNAAPVPGTGTQVPGKYLSMPYEYVPVWWSQTHGFTIGAPGGEAFIETAERLAETKFGAGAMITREHEGMTQLVSTLRQPNGSAARATDSVVAEVRRN
jgi:hypothetical protein